jgi:hypothetical protein
MSSPNSPIAEEAGSHGAAHEAEEGHLLSELDVGFSLGETTTSSRL